MSSALPFPIAPSRASRAVPRAPAAPKPHHSGHRERLRQRAHGAGLNHLPDYELLELFLFRSLPRGDVKPLAKALLARFGSLAAVLAAPVEAIVTVKVEDSRGKPTGPGVETALALTALHEIARRIAREEPAKRPVISSWTALLAYVRMALQHEAREQVRVLYLDNRNQLILDEARVLGLELHDHLVVGRDGVASFKQLGLM